jgi:hypothetical protein
VSAYPHCTREACTMTHLGTMRAKPVSSRSCTAVTQRWPALVLECAGTYCSAASASVAGTSLRAAQCVLGVETMTCVVVAPAGVVLQLSCAQVHFGQQLGPLLTPGTLSCGVQMYRMACVTPQATTGIPGPHARAHVAHMGVLHSRGCHSALERRPCSTYAAGN